MEARLKRPYFAAAPGVGAARAAFDACFAGEAAIAQDKESASTLADLKQFYEHVEVMEFAVGARRLGLPLEIVALTAHLYMGPRCIRVGNAYSRKVFPRRSILAGCTWATVHIRFYMIEPADRFCDVVGPVLREWELSFRFSVYVDDVMVAVMGRRQSIAHCLPWLSRLLLQWILRVLQKPVAVQKLQCVASSAGLKGVLVHRMNGIGVPVNLFGENLGVDYAAGGRLWKRPLQRKRLKAAQRRKSRISWWRRQGGNAVSVVRSGLRPAVEFGSDCIGLPDSYLLQLRRIYGAAVGVSCGGSSLTARLALGGNKYEDIDPAAIDSNPPLLALACRIWDDPKVRYDFIKAWSAARAEAGQCGCKWNWVRGPVGAAWVSLARVGALWPSPFVIRLLGRDVSLLEVPPLQIKAILQAHARRHLDLQLIERLVQSAPEWDALAIRVQYQHGVDWSLLRLVLRGNAGNLAPAERAALRVFSCGNFWPEERRWLAGYTGQGSCEACFKAIGTVQHRIYECDALQQMSLIFARLEERLPARALRSPTEAL